MTRPSFLSLSPGPSRPLGGGVILPRAAGEEKAPQTRRYSILSSMSSRLVGPRAVTTSAWRPRMIAIFAHPVIAEPRVEIEAEAAI